LAERVIDQWSDDPTGDIARAEKAIDAGLALQPDNSYAHFEKAAVDFVKRQWGPAIAENEAAIADDHNNAPAYANASAFKVFFGHAEDGFIGLEKALQLSPRDPSVPIWQFWICALHNHLAQWDKAIEWCNKAVASAPQFWWAVAELAAANAWAGHDKEAKDAAAQLLKVYPGFTVQTWAGIHWTDDPTFNAQYQRITEGLRKAGVPEGEQKTN
jgi:tetratricopeptide (TPR) repeat protein